MESLLDCGFGIHFPYCREYPAIRDRFLAHAKKWNEETFLSSKLEYEHPAYQAVIAMGPKAIIPILEEISLRPHWWFHALEKILLNTGNPLIPRDKPVYPADSNGRLDILTKAWLDWGSHAGLLSMIQIDPAEDHRH
jgi:hypothetical protein